MDTTKTITHLSLCSGYEGIGLGLRRVLPNLREIAYVEREGFPVANLVAKMESGELDAAPVFTDVKTFPYGKFRGCVDILSGGFPCQPFSAAGKRQATEDPRHLFPYIRDGIRDCQPRIVFLENVEGIISAKTADGESILHYVLRELEGLGYRATAGIFSAEEVGAPHQRKRVFIMAYRNSVRHDGRELSDRDGGWSLPKQAQPRPEQPLVRGEAEGCSRDARTELDDSRLQRQEESEQQAAGLEQSSEELGNASDLRLQQSSADSRKTGTDQSGEERRMYESQGASSLSEYGPQSQGSQELANTEGSQSGFKTERQRREDSSGGGEEKLSDSDHKGFPRRNESPEGNPQGREAQAGQHTPLDAGLDLWVSRPNEPQYEWEEPRVVESQLGRTVNGNASRVDRLRLLGNGVVPATASKAFVTLIQRLV